MTIPGAADTLRAEARALAARGAWDSLCALLLEDESRARAQPELIVLLAEGLVRTGHARDGCVWVTVTLAAIEASGDRALLRRAVNVLGAAHFELGSLDEAQLAFERAVELGREDGDDLVVARATNNLGAIANVRGRRDAALALYKLAVPAHQRLGNRAGLAECFHNMAITFRDLGRLEQADEYERRAIDFAQEAANPRLAALARLGRAEVSLRAGDAALAEATARRAATAFAGLWDPVREGDALRLVGLASLAQQHYDAAADALGAALDIARTHGATLNEAETHRALAEVARAHGDMYAARHHAAAALALFERLAATKERDALFAWLATLPRTAHEPA